MAEIAHARILEPNAQAHAIRVVAEVERQRGQRDRSLIQAWTRCEWPCRNLRDPGAGDVEPEGKETQDLALERCRDDRAVFSGLEGLIWPRRLRILEHLGRCPDRPGPDPQGPTGPEVCNGREGVDV